MDKILRDLKDPKLWELWYIPYYGQCRILSISCMKKCSKELNPFSARALLDLKPQTANPPTLNPKTRNLKPQMSNGKPPNLKLHPLSPNPYNSLYNWALTNASINTTSPKR